VISIESRASSCYHFEWKDGLIDGLDIRLFDLSSAIQFSGDHRHQAEFARCRAKILVERVSQSISTC
jgi:hypothetical protein